MTYSLWPVAEYPLPLLQATRKLVNENVRIISDFAVKPQSFYKTLSEQYLTTTVPINLLLLMRIIIVQGDIPFTQTAPDPCVHGTWMTGSTCGL